jgi:hypothetical protein
MKRFSIALCALAFAGFGIAAMSVRPMSTEELVRAADCIVVADVETIRSDWTSDGKALETFVTLDVSECWKGAPVDTVVVRVPGGQVGALKLTVSEAATFAPGERVIVFLRANGTRVETVGWFRGKFSIAGDKVREIKGKTVAAFRGEVTDLVRQGR